MALFTVWVCPGSGRRRASLAGTPTIMRRSTNCLIARSTALKLSFLTVKPGGGITPHQSFFLSQTAGGPSGPSAPPADIA